MKRITTIFTAIAVSVAALFTTSCVQDLDVTPIDPNIQTPEDVLNSIEAYQQLLAKCYWPSATAVCQSAPPKVLTPLPTSTVSTAVTASTCVPSSTCRSSLLMRPAPAGMTKPSSPSMD